MDVLLIEQEFKRIESLLLDRSNWRDMELSRDWARMLISSNPQLDALFAKMAT